MLLLIDGFDTTNLTYNWPFIPDIVNLTVDTGTYRPGAISPAGALKAANGTANLWLPHYFNTTYTTLITGFAYKIPTITTAHRCLRFLSASTTGTITDICSAGINSANHKLDIYQNNSWTGILSGYTLTAGQWYYIEALLQIGNGTSDIWVYVDGTLYATVNCLTPGITGINGFALGLSDSLATAAYFDDLYVCDTGGTVNNAVLGNCRVTTRLPSGAGTNSTWTPKSGANYTNVDDSPVDDGDGTYVSTALANTDTYNYADILNTPEYVYGLRLNSIARKTPGTGRLVQNVVFTAGTTDASANLAVPESFGNLSTIFEQVPPFANNVTWRSQGVQAATNINNSEFGFKFIS